jgi:large subunit ribosomal protein L5
MGRLNDKYIKEVAPKLKTELKVANVHQVPHIEKVVLNVGLGRSLQDSKLTDVATNTMRKITGQQPVKTIAKHSIAGFKLREGNVIGLKVTLRRDRMYEFLDRLISIVLPRTRDFRGLSANSFDPQGNYSIGLRDQSVFPELSYEDTVTTHGLQINVVTSASNPSDAKQLLVDLGFPFERTA